MARDLADRYRAEGWWNDATLGATVADGLESMAGAGFRVRSKVRPWSGTFADVDRAARSLAATLRSRGIGPGDVVVCQLPNWVEAGISFWAAAYLGAVVVPIVHFYGAKEVDYILRATEPEAVVTADRFGHADHLGMYEDLLSRHPTQALAGGRRDACRGAAGRRHARSRPRSTRSPSREPATVDPDAPALVAFTSGTTRDPKGVVHSHRTIGCETRQLNDLFPGGGPPQITGAPVGHFIGMLSAFLVPLLRHPARQPDRRLGPGRGAAHDARGGARRRRRGDLLPHEPARPSRLHRRAPGVDAVRRPRRVVGPGRRHRARRHASASRCSAPTGAPNTPRSPARRSTIPRPSGSPPTGVALPGVEVRLDGDGQILSRGPDCFVGYTDPDLTAAVFDDDGWYRTGDVGVLDDDGYLTITDRVSDIIIRGGENISAQEIEELMLRMEAVAEVSVVAAPDERLGEHAAAVVQVRDGMPAPTLDDVRTHLAAAGLARQKWPESLYEVREFPRTPSGKVQKFRLRQQLRDGQLETSKGALA